MKPTHNKIKLILWLKMKKMTIQLECKMNQVNLSVTTISMKLMMKQMLPQVTMKILFLLKKKRQVDLMTPVCMNQLKELLMETVLDTAVIIIMKQMSLMSRQRMKMTLRLLDQILSSPDTMVLMDTL